MTTVTRNDVQAEIATEINGLFSNSEIPASARYAYRPADYRGAIAALAIYSNGTLVSRGSFANGHVAYRIHAEILVATTRFTNAELTAVDNTFGASEHQVLLNQLCEKVSDWILQNPGERPGKWKTLDQADMSSDFYVDIGGRHYRYERFALDVRIF